MVCQTSSYQVVCELCSGAFQIRGPVNEHEEVEVQTQPTTLMPPWMLRHVDG